MAATKQAVQELKSERVQEESLALMRQRILGQDDPVGAAMAVTRNRAEERLKAERVQTRLQQMQAGRQSRKGRPSAGRGSWRTRWWRPRI